MDNYCYRLDSIRLFEILKRYVTKNINILYETDEHVEKDPKIQNLYEELKSHPNWKNPLMTKKDLINYASALWWVTVGYHAISFATEDFETYFAFRPTCLSKPMPLYDF